VSQVEDVLVLDLSVASRIPCGLPFPAAGVCDPRAGLDNLERGQVPQLLSLPAQRRLAGCLALVVPFAPPLGVVLSVAPILSACAFAQTDPAPCVAVPIRID
jgi:hypothetical protein